MKSLTRPIVALAFLVAAAGLFTGTIADDAVVVADDAVTMEGSFVWEREDGDRTGDLTAVFTPTGENAWDVAFHFEWEDEPHIYTGTAEGSLEDGNLAGDVVGDNEDHKPRFHFSGTSAAGTFNGTHSYYDKEGELQPSGTLTLELAG